MSSDQDDEPPRTEVLIGIILSVASIAVTGVVGLLTLATAIETAVALTFTTLMVATALLLYVVVIQ